MFKVSEDVLGEMMISKGDVVVMRFRSGCVVMGRISRFYENEDFVVFSEMQYRFYDVRGYEEAVPVRHWSVTGAEEIMVCRDEHPYPAQTPGYNRTDSHTATQTTSTSTDS